jgi:hypothetical protein
MAPPTGIFQKYSAVGLREALSDVIANIDPEETPVFSNAGRETVKNTDFEWQTDSLEAVDVDNAHVDGDDVSTFDAVTPTVRLKNYTQISRKTLVIPGTLEAIEKAGRKSEIAYQMVKRGKEMRRDMETIITANQAGVAGDGTVTPRRTGSLLAFLKTNTDFGVGGVDPVYTNTPNATRTDGTQRNFTEALIKTVAHSIWSSGGSLKMIVVGGTLKQVFSTFTGIADIRLNAQGARPTTIIGAADVYVTDFGNLSVVPNRFMRNRDALFLDPSYYSIVNLRSLKVEDLAKTGDAHKKMMIVEWGLKVKTEKALGGVFDLNPVSV